MSAFNTSTRKEDVSMKLRTQNMKYTRTQTKKLEEDSRKMEERLKELKTAMSREKEERERQGGGFWDRGQMYTGSLTNYATEVLKTKPQNVPKEGKKKKIKVLHDEPLDLPTRSSQPGTMKYIAQRKMTSGPSPREKQKGPKCGQCEERQATLSCVQCSEMYCAGCFAAFHIKGALKKHRSIPISASGPRVCMSPRTSIDGQSPRGSQASGSLGIFDEPPRNGSEAAGPHSTVATPRSTDDPPTLLQGDYDESESAASFQQALMAWRQGDTTPPSEPVVSARKKTSRPIASPVKSPVFSVDSSTGTVEQAQVPDIKFKASLSYTEKLMLKKHRRTELSEVSTPRLDSQSESSYRPSRESSGRSSQQTLCKEGDRGIYRDPSFADAEERVNFHSLFEAVVSNEAQSPELSSSDTSLPLGMSYGENPPVLHSSSTYLVTEVSPYDSWEMEQKRQRDLNSSTFVFENARNKIYLPVQHSSQASRFEPVTELYSTPPTPSLPAATTTNNHNDNNRELKGNNNNKNSEKEDTITLGDLTNKKTSKPSSARRKDSVKSDATSAKDLEDSSMAATPVARPKSVRAKSAKSRPVSRAQSRAQSRDQSRAPSRMSQEEGVLTKAPSQALSQIARMIHDADLVYQSPMEDFFLVGVAGGDGGDVSQRKSDSRGTVKDSRHMQQSPRPKSRGAQALKSARGEREAIKVSNRLYQMAPRSWRPDSSLGDTIPLGEVKVEAEPEADPDMILSYTYSGQMSGRATEWRPSSSQSGIFMPGDDLGLGLQNEMAADALIQSQTSNDFDTPRQSQEFSSPASRSGTPARRKSANRRSEISADDDIDVTPRAGSLRDSKSSHRHSTSRPISKQSPSHHGDSDTSSMPVKTSAISSDTSATPSQARSQNRIGSSRAGSRLGGVDILPSRSDFANSSRLPSSSRSQRHTSTAAEGSSSSRLESQDSFMKSSQPLRAPRSKEGSHLSSKSGVRGGAAVERRHSDIEQTQRPASSSHPTQISSRTARQEDNKHRPNSSTGGKEYTGFSKSLSSHSMDMEGGSSDTVIADMLANRVNTDVWSMGNDDAANNQMSSLEQRPTSSSSHRGLRQSASRKSKRPDSGHWETEVVPFDRETSESRQSVLSVRDQEFERKAKRPASSRPSSTMSGRESRAIVMEGEDLSLYDQVGRESERDEEDKQTLDKLEWELASDTGRLTADGNISRRSILEPEEETSSRSSSRSSTRSLRMSVDNSYDISAKLQEDDRLAQQDFDEFNMRRSMTMDEDEVKALG